MYEYFVAQGLTLTAENGCFGFVVPDRLGFNSQFAELRKRILSKMRVISLVYKVPFPGITADTMIFIFEKGVPRQDHYIQIAEYDKARIEISQALLLRHPSHVFEYFENRETMELINKISLAVGHSLLSSICETTSGFGGKSELIHMAKSNEREIPVLKGDSIGRYVLRKTYWFDFRKENITGRTTDPAKLGASPKILLRKTGDRIMATYDESSFFIEQSLYFLYNFRGSIEPKFILGILNSSFFTFYYRAKALTNKKSIAQVKKVDLDQLPIRTIDFDDPADRARHDRMVALVEQMLALHKELPAAATDHDQTLIRRRIDAADRQIDALVYELYGLTPEEIAVVEGSVR